MSSYARRREISDSRILEMLDHADDLPEGNTQVSVLDEAANLADSIGDEVAAYEARMELLAAAVFAGVPKKALVAYAWCLAKQSTRPELFDEYELVWRYKWVATKLASFPQISLAEIWKTVDDMEGRIRGLGGTMRIVHHVRWEVLTDLGKFDEAAIQYAQWKAVPRDGFADCAACERNSEVWWHCENKQYKQAVKTAQPILDGMLRCNSVPQATYGHVLEPLLKLERLDEARQYHQRGMRMLESVPSDVSDAAQHMKYLAAQGEKAKAVRLLERYLPFAAVGYDMDKRFWFYVAVVRVMEMLRGNQNRNRKLRVPTTLKCYREDDTYRPGDLAEWFHAEASQLAAQFDGRNESSRFGDALRD